MRRGLLFIALVSAFAAPLQALPTAETLLNRADMFKSLGLLAVAREQYKFVLKNHPDNKDAARALEELSKEEVRIHVNNANDARKQGALQLAALEMNRAINADPANEKLKKAGRDIVNEQNLKNQLNARVSNDYLEGLKRYQDGHFDQALEYFVRVLNISPDHKGALRYVEKVGQKLGAVR